MQFSLIIESRFQRFQRYILKQVANTYFYRRIEMMTNNHLEPSSASKIPRMTDSGGGSSPFQHPQSSTPVSGSSSTNFNNKSADAKSK